MDVDEPLFFGRREHLSAHGLSLNGLSGWGHHPVSVAKYHFVIRADADAEGWDGGVGKGHKLCPNCGLVIPASIKK